MMMMMTMTRRRARARAMRRARARAMRRRRRILEGFDGVSLIPRSTGLNMGGSQHALAVLPLLWFHVLFGRGPLSWEDNLPKSAEENHNEDSEET